MPSMATTTDTSINENARITPNYTPDDARRMRTDTLWCSVETIWREEVGATPTGAKQARLVQVETVPVPATASVRMPVPPTPSQAGARAGSHLPAEARP